MMPGLIASSGLVARTSGNDAYTTLLLHMNGTNASTTFTDSCAGASAHTFTASGSAQISTAQAKFGGASGLFNGTTDYASTPDSADFAMGSASFTVDLWFYRAGGDGTYRSLIGQTSAGSTDTSFSIGLHTTNVIRAAVTPDGVTPTVVFGTTTFMATGWHHVAFVRTGNVLKLFVDGTQEGGDVAFASSVRDSSSNLSVGRHGEYPGNYWNGYLDEIRISKGIARWVSNFTPPSAPYV